MKRLSLSLLAILGITHLAAGRKMTIEEQRAWLESRLQRKEGKHEAPLLRVKSREEITPVEKDEGPVIHLKNDSRWNAVVRYTTEGTEQEETIRRQGSKGDTLELPIDIEDLTDIYVFPDSPKWRNDIAKHLADGKINKRDLLKRMQDFALLNPDDEASISITIPKLPGGTFEGFAFTVDAHKEIEPINAKKEAILKKVAHELKEKDDEAALEEVLKEQKSTSPEEKRERYITNIRNSAMKKKKKKQLIEQIKRAPDPTSVLIDNKDLSPTEFMHVLIGRKKYKNLHHDYHRA